MMRIINIKTILSLLSILLLTQSGHSRRIIETKANGEYQPDHGPFNSRGYYIEKWADNPPKRIYRKSKSARKTPVKKVTVKKVPAKKVTVKKTPTKKVTAKKISSKRRPPVMHLVRKGDTIYGLSRKYNASPKDIIRANKIRRNIIRVGQKIIIPRKK